MVIYERVEGSTDLVRAYSDQGLKIMSQDGIPYDEAIDPDYMNRVYQETDEPVDTFNDPDEEPEEDSDELSAKEALRIITGGEE